MLAAIEARLLAVVTAALAGRDHVAIGAAGSGGDPAAGEGTVRVGCSAVSPVTGYDRRALLTSPPKEAPRIRTIGVAVEAFVDLARRPAAGDTDGSAARARLVDDLALIAWALDEERLQRGTAFDPQGRDQGFAVTEARLGDAAVPGADAGGVLRARLTLRIMGELWPVDTAETGEAIERATILVAPESLQIDLEEGSVVVGGVGHVHLRGLATTWAHRPEDLTRPDPPALVARVVSTLDAGMAGTVASGAAGPEPGTRVLRAAAGDIVLDYHAPAAMPPDGRLERLEVSLADKDNRPGLLLAAIAIPLRPGP